MLKNTAYFSCNDNWEVHMIQSRRDGYVYFTTLNGVTTRLRNERIVEDDIHSISKEDAEDYFCLGAEENDE